MYTAVDAAYHDVVTEHPVVRDTAPQYRRAGINLASHALTLLRLPVRSPTKSATRLTTSARLTRRDWYRRGLCRR